jgi:DNA-binding NarL/FixJ family response regulator
MTKPRSILIWGNEDILSSSIELFLDARENWNVVNLSNTDDLEALMRAVEATRPDIVIINQECQANRVNLPLGFLMDYPAIKVITINLENNAMEVYSSQKITVKQTSDLIAAIESK